jgi:ABC-2 type transport system ATP-binding protein
MSFDGDMGALLAAASARYSIVDISTQDADLEEIFLTYYHDEEEAV